MVPVTELRKAKLGQQKTKRISESCVCVSVLLVAGPELFEKFLITSINTSAATY